jgi:hypothetical protein
MLTYSAVVALYLAYLGFVGSFAGVVLWPAVALHSLTNRAFDQSICGRQATTPIKVDYFGLGPDQWNFRCWARRVNSP